MTSGGSALDASVTLEEVFAVVGTKRVPLAPELAGYLVLEIAEHADPAGGDVDPKSVFVGEEGTVALVKPKRDGASGDAETSIRGILARLLEASGSQTPALSAASKRRSGGGLPTLSEELEAALIPVNRAAGRRALARLAREVKRVTLGVGRNALPSTSDAAQPRRASSPTHAAAAPEIPPPPLPAALPPPSTPPPPVVASPGPPPARLPPPSVPPPRQVPASTPPPPLAVLPPITPPPPKMRSVPPPAATFSREEEPTTARGKVPEDLLRTATPMGFSEMPTTQFEPPRAPSPSQADVDSLIADFGVSGGGSEQQHARELKKMAGLEPTPPPPEIARRMETKEFEPPPSSGGGAEVEALLAMTGEPARAARPAPAAPARSASAASYPETQPGGSSAGPARPRAPPPDPRQLPTGPSEVKRVRISVPDGRFRSRRGGIVALVIAVVAVGGGAYAVWRIVPGVLGHGPDHAQSATPSASTAAPARPCHATLVVSDVPQHAEVLLRQGQAPVDVESMPVGARLEFVATAEGYAPKRVVVPAGAAWDPGASGTPRYEAGVQLERSRAKPGSNDPWPAGEPGSEVGGNGPPGTVHVVSTPRGAEVWMLVGIGPEARISMLKCDQELDVLIAGPTTYRKRLHVAASEFAPEDVPGAKVPTMVAHVSGK
jgi:hypothetical protein